MDHNTRLDYMYRDGNNYKRHGSVILSGPHTKGDELDITESCDERRYFIAEQVGLPNVFLWSPEANYDPDDETTWPPDFSDGYVVTEADHGWHEFVGLEATDEPPNDPRTLRNVVDAFKLAAKVGWWDPEVPLARGRRGYLIDPEQNSIEEVLYDGIDDIYRLLKISCFDVARLDNGEAVYVDDTGLLTEPKWFFKVEGYPGILAGRGLYVGRVDEEGETLNPTSTIEDVRRKVRMFDALTLDVILALARSASAPYG